MTSRLALLLLLAACPTLAAAEEGSTPRHSTRPEPAKGADVDVQNGTVQFGIVQYGPPQSTAMQSGVQPNPFEAPGGMNLGGPFGPATVAPPSAMPRMLRVRIALLEADPKAKKSSEALISITEMQEMIDQEETMEVIDSFDLTTVTGHETKVQQGARKPFVTGTQIIAQRGADGRAAPLRTNSYSQQDVGTLLKVAPQMFGQRALLRVNFERSDIVRLDDDEEEEDDEEDDIRRAAEPPATTTMTIETAVMLESGQATVLSTRDSRGVRHLLLIGVEILDAGDQPMGVGGMMGGGGFF